MDDLTEATLIEGARRGDRASQEAVVRLYERRVYGLVLRFVENREDARDIVQDTMVRALTSINRYDGSYPFASWLFRIAANRALDFLRRRKIEFRIFEYEGGPEGLRSGGRGSAGAASGTASPGAPDAEGHQGIRIDQVADPGTPHDAVVLNKIDWAIVERCLNRLEPRYRTVLHLRYRDELAYKEIARVLAIPIGTVKILLHRGHAQLRREVLSETGGEEGGRGVE